MSKIPTHPRKHVFLAYRSKNEKGRHAAKKLGRFLKEKGLSIWYFPRKVGWSDSITAKEEQAISDSFGAVICLTADFLDGQTAKEEYRALSAKRREDPHFKLGYLLVGCDYEVVPPFMKDYFGARIENIKDPKFKQEATKIYRGLLGLPLEPPELKGKVEPNSIGEGRTRRLARARARAFYHMLVWPNVKDLFSSYPEIESDLKFEDCREIIEDIRESEAFFLNGRKRKSDRVDRYEAYRTDKKLKVLSKEDRSFVRTSDYQLITRSGDRITREFIRKKH